MHARTIVRLFVAAAGVAALAIASFSLALTRAAGASVLRSETVSRGAAAEIGQLSGVAATPGGGAWAVGFSGADPDAKSLALYWNGSVWKQVPSPSPPNAQLRSIVATSLTNAWAVGSRGDDLHRDTLLLHWNGKTWQQMPSIAGTLSGVAATSPMNAWAVGFTNSAGTLILHWNGKTWQQMPSIAGTLSGVVATSPTNAWAVGSTNGGNSLILHWNGTTWQQTPSANPGSDQGLASFLSGVAVSSGKTFWAVGDGNNCGCGPGTSLVERWNGQTWGQVPTPTTGGGINLFGVASLPSGRSWAVGLSGSGDSPTSGVVLQWTGTAWTRAAIPDLRSVEGGLFGVVATSRSNAWAVGWESAGDLAARTPGNSGTPRIVILHWTGSAWKSVFPIARSSNTVTGGTGTTTTTTTLPETTTTTTVSPTTTPPSTATAAGPLLGSAAWGLAAGAYAGISGFGEVAPTSFSEGGVAESPHVDSISWSNWGAPQATGQGQAIDGTGQSGPVSTWPVVSATVVAFDLGTCDGTTSAYQEVTYYFPQDGQTFDPTKATNACTGQ